MMMMAVLMMEMVQWCLCGGPWQRYSNGYSNISGYSMDLASQVTPLVVTSHPSLSSLSPTSRGCLLPHESDLDHHAAYSVSRLWSLLSLSLFWLPFFSSFFSSLFLIKLLIFSSCRLECGLARAEREVGCVPWALPRGPGTKVH